MKDYEDIFHTFMAIQSKEIILQSFAHLDTHYASRLCRVRLVLCRKPWAELGKSDLAGRSKTHKTFASTRPDATFESHTS